MTKTINKFYNPQGKPIDERIKKFETQIFESKLDADAEAKRLRSYSYQVFDADGNQIAHAVPK